MASARTLCPGDAVARPALAPASLGLSGCGGRRALTGREAAEGQALCRSRRAAAAAGRVGLPPSPGPAASSTGDYFGILMEARVTRFPFSVLDNPMYWGSTAVYLGWALM